MQIQLTDFAVSYLAANPGPPTLTGYKLGSAYNYTPLPTDTDIHGTLLFSGVPTPPVAENANLVKYSLYLDYNIGDFDFGEVALELGGQLFALGSASELIHKIQGGVTVGNSIRLDIYLSMVGTNYFMFLDVAESNNSFRVASIDSPDMLPPSHEATPNMYVIKGAGANQSPMLAYTDRNGLWNFDAYQYAVIGTATITGFDNYSVTIALADHSANMDPVYFGQVILEFVTGQLYSICRYVKTSVQSGSHYTLGFNTPLAQLPVVGDKFQVYQRLQNTALPPIPIATASVLGGIKIGAGLLVQPDGTCSVDTSTLNAVVSINGMDGVVTLDANNLPLLATVGKTGSYNDLIDKPAPYSLPIATQSVLGGVKAPPSGNLVISGTGVIDFSFVPVKSVNGFLPDAGGNVTVTSGDIGLINPVAVTGGSNLDAFNITGLFTIASGVAASLVNAPATASGAATLEVVPVTVSGTGDSVQRYTTDVGMWWRKKTGVTWGTWNQVSTSVIATNTVLGVVKIGTGLQIAGDGTLSWSTAALPVATTATLGVIQVGSGLAITAGGVLSATAYTLPTASATILGGVKVGSGLSIDGAGVLTATPASDASKLNRVNGVAVGVQMAFVDLGSRTPANGVPVTVSAANVQAATFTSGAVTWTTSGWPASGTYAEVQMEVINGGLATHTFPAAFKWVNPDGTAVASFTTYIGNQRSGATNFQTSGTDFLIMWSRDGGASIFAKVM